MAIDDALFGMHLRRGEPQFVGIVIAGRGDATQDLAHFRIVVNQPQQGLSASAPAAHAKNVFGGGIKINDEQTIIQQDDA